MTKTPPMTVRKLELAAQENPGGRVTFGRIQIWFDKAIRGYQYRCDGVRRTRSFIEDVLK